ncbi:asparagine synthase-domain-containing protein [Obelidium mucronatum]|nr:asparagine synthase-domain-containing protein [Obelidium mucronatum]
MCGILFRLYPKLLPTSVTQPQSTPEVLRLSRATFDACSVWSHLSMMVARRGPDVQKTVNWTLEDGKNGPVHASLFSSVLHLRGLDPVQQPLVDKASGSLFCWNGELFNEETGMQVDEQSSDTSILFDTIQQKCSSDDASFKDSLLSVLSTLRGPWSILFYHSPSSTLYFGRDVLGRRSLVVHFPNQALVVDNSENSDSVVSDPGFWISSVAGCIQERTSGDVESADIGDNSSEVSSNDDAWWGDGPEFWHELPADGIYSVCLKDLDLFAGKEEFKRHLVHHPWQFSSQSSECLISPTNPFLNASIPTPSDLPNYKQLENPVENVEIPPPVTEPSETALKEFTRLLSASVSARVETITQQCRMHNVEQEPLGVLFSGGLDCMVLAALAAKNLPPGSPIDLLNVAFDNPRVRRAAADAAVLQAKREKKAMKKGKGGGAIPTQDIDQTATEKESNAKLSNEGDKGQYPSHLFSVPDRKTGLKGYEELKRTFPDTLWRFVEIDIEFEEAQRLKPWIMGLVNPLESVMDLSIALAFWFASRGRGAIVNCSGDRIPYETKAKVLLSGLGADEQLGGYNRHRKHFDISGWEGLLHELQKDVSRISKRNLGRDDRIVSDHGREIRFPYLSEALISHLSSIPVHIKTDPRLPRGVGDKLLLRQLAQSLGLNRASLEVKRAVQFGARTAKMTDGREKGTTGVTF